MLDSFVPLVPESSEHSNLSFVKMPQAVSPLDSPAAVKLDDSCGEPVVTLRRNGEHVSAICVQCSCGRVIEINCVF